MRRVIRVFAIVALGAATSAGPSHAAKGAAAPSAPRAVTDLDRFSGGLESLARRVSPAVVQIFATTLTPVSTAEQAAGGLIARQRGSGSGVIVDPAGFIVTNAHVVAGARRVQVQLAEPRPGSPGRSILKPAGPRLEAKVLGIDHETDLAVIKIDGANLPTLPFADSDLLRQGQVALAFGSPLGLESSVSMGVISATVRQIEADSPMIYLQTDAAIHPGNSGGPLVDTHGAVVGINTFILSSPAGDAVGFAAPSNIVSAIYQQLRHYGHVRRGEIGVRAQSITPEVAQGLGLARDWGAILSDVYPGSPADAAGLKTGDIVTSVDGKVMENGRQLEINLYRHMAGEEVTLEVEREGVKSSIPVTLIERTGDVDRLAAMARPEDNLIEPLQVVVVPVDPQIARVVPMRQPWGVLVAVSTGDAPPGGAPLAAGDVIRSVGRTTTRSVEDLRRELAGRKSGSWVVLHVERQGRMIYVPCEMP